MGIYTESDVCSAADFLASERIVRDHEVERIVEDKELHKVSQLVLVWAFSLYYSDHKKVGWLIKLLESENEAEINKFLDEKTVQFMLIGSNHNWKANCILHQRYPHDPNFSHMMCHIFVNFKYMDKGCDDLALLQIVSLIVRNT